MTLMYQCGEAIEAGDRVTYGGNAGTIELVRTGWHSSHPAHLLTLAVEKRIDPEAL
jgi:hypothetical protein